MRGQKGEPVQELSEMLNGMQLLAHWQEQLIHAMQRRELCAVKVAVTLYP